MVEQLQQEAGFSAALDVSLASVGKALIESYCEDLRVAFSRQSSAGLLKLEPFFQADAVASKIEFLRNCAAKVARAQGSLLRIAPSMADEDIISELKMERGADARKIVRFLDRLAGDLSALGGMGAQIRCGGIRMAASDWRAGRRSA